MDSSFANMDTCNLSKATRQFLITNDTCDQKEVANDSYEFTFFLMKAMSVQVKRKNP
jgi:hypothetical protein